MEQESVGGQASAAMQALEFDKKVRMEANLGFQQIKSIEHQLRIAPQGVLGKADGSDAQALRAAILSASATVVGSFTKIISLLSAPPNSNSSRNENFSPLERTGGGGGSSGGGGGGSQDRIYARAESPMSSAHTYDSTPPHSPRRVPAPAPAAASSSRLMMNSASPAMSPCHTPQSGSGLSEGSPPNPVSPPLNLDLDGEAARPGRQAAANEASTSADPELSEQRALSRKRKFMPKYTCKQPASGTDPGNDGPPDDGHTWRKYGQKDILGSRFPRSYYRCTHKTEVGCPAIKYVQRSDEEPLMFDVTYRGNHTCLSMQQHSAWPFPFSPEQFALALTGAQQHSPSDSPAMLKFSGLGGSHMTAPVAPSIVVASAEDLMLGRRPGFPQVKCSLPMSGAPSTSTVVGMPSSQVMAPVMPSRFGLSPSPSMELDDVMGFSVKPEQPPYNTSRSPQDHSVFGQNPSLLNMRLTGARPGSTINAQGHPGDQMLARSDPNNSDLGMDRLPEAQYVGRWEQDISSDDILQPDAAGVSRYNNYAPVVSDVEHSRHSHNNHPAAGERGYFFPVKESDTSEHTSAIPYPMGFMDSPMGVMDYEPFNEFYECA